ncbi:MAG: hypothetical protein AB1656_11660 [Candidatus Omnitrophota bacterium]
MTNPNQPSACRCSRRNFIVTSSAAVLGTASARGAVWASENKSGIAPAGPASKYQMKIKAAFVRRKEDYGILWPGAIYDGEAARKNYSRQIHEAAEKIGAQLDLRPQPIYSEADADEWIAQAESQKPDGLFLVLLDRQQHAWPTAAKAVECSIPTVIYSPVGTSFTTNTIPLANKTGAVIFSSDDFRQAEYGMKMIHAGARLRETRCIVIKGDERRDEEVPHFGTKLRYIPANDFFEEYGKIPLSDEVKTIAAEYKNNATKITGASEEDLFNGVKSFVAARNILEREEGDAITMDCLGALGKTKVSLPCISWSRMLDHGVPAACEADIGAAVTHALVQYLFDRPGFQQDPVAETARECIIGAHCTCPTRLNGFSQPPEPFSLSHHHGDRDAVPLPQWKIGQRITVADVILRSTDAVPQMIVSCGEVVENVSVPPAGGCVVSVMVKLDGVTDVLNYPGFHQIFFYGDYKKELKAYCQLYGIEPMVV